MFFGNRLLVTSGAHLFISYFQFFQAIGTKFTTQYPLGSYAVQGYLSRPQARWRYNAVGFRRTTDFIETIQQLRPLHDLGMHDSDFVHAYKIAGTRFLGSMQEFFLVLLDSSPSNPSLTAPPGATAQTREPTPSGSQAVALPITGQKRTPGERDQDVEQMDVAPSAKSSRSEASLVPSASASVARRLQTTHVSQPLPLEF